MAAEGKGKKALRQRSILNARLQSGWLTEEFLRCEHHWTDDLADVHEEVVAYVGEVAYFPESGEVLFLHQDCLQRRRHQVKHVLVLQTGDRRPGLFVIKK